jgi:hypothetical protein
VIQARSTNSRALFDGWLTSAWSRRPRAGRGSTRIVIRTLKTGAMTIDVATASWLVLGLLSLFMLLVAGAGWVFLGFWGRMWSESLSSRSVERRFLRWQRFAFRGHYPLGKWRRPGAAERVQLFTFVGRALLIVIVLVWFIAVTRRAILDLSQRSTDSDHQAWPLRASSGDSPNLWQVSESASFGRSVCYRAGWLGVGNAV